MLGEPTDPSVHPLSQRVPLRRKPQGCWPCADQSWGSAAVTFACFWLNFSRFLALEEGPAFISAKLLWFAEANIAMCTGTHRHTSDQECYNLMQMPLKLMCHIGGVTVVSSERTVDSRTQIPPKGLHHSICL